MGSTCHPTSCWAAFEGRYSWDGSLGHAPPASGTCPAAPDNLEAVGWVVEGDREMTLIPVETNGGKQEVKDDVMNNQ